TCWRGSPRPTATVTSSGSTISFTSPGSPATTADALLGVTASRRKTTFSAETVSHAGERQRTPVITTTKGVLMGAADNASRVRKGYAAFNAGDVATLVDLFAEDIVWHFPGQNKLSGDHIGRDAALTALGGYGEA